MTSPRVSAETTAPHRAMRHNVNALILDDSQFERTKIRRLFRSLNMPFYLKEVDSLRAFQDVLGQQMFDVILIDFNLPQGDGLLAAQAVQDHPENTDTPTILITGYDKSEIAVNALKTGCLDYIAKNQLSAHRLEIMIQSAIEFTAAKREEAQTMVDAQDALTRSAAAKFANMVQPELASIVRENRRIKATMANPNSNLPDDLGAVEQRCIALWAALLKPGDARVVSPSCQQADVTPIR